MVSILRSLTSRCTQIYSLSEVSIIIEGKKSIKIIDILADDCSQRDGDYDYMRANDAHTDAERRTMRACWRMCITCLLRMHACAVMACI